MALGFDPQKHTFHSPLFRSVVTEAIAFLDNTPLLDLPPKNRFDGAGVYAIYYAGDFGLYAPLSKKNQAGRPIYVGKAVPPGWRQGRRIASANAALYTRLNEHGRSITQTSNLNLSHFSCRFMILTGAESDLVVPVEAELIRKYAPLWNSVLDGFGNHDPGKGRYKQSISEWDILHPGRSWVKRIIGPVPERAKIERKVAAFLSKN